jgi:hypothetical protein
VFTPLGITVTVITMNSTSIISVVGWGHAGRRRRLGSASRLGGLSWCRKCLAFLCGLLAGSVLAGLLLKAAKGVRDHGEARVEARQRCGSLQNADIART